jgi:hypothetical protein
MFARNPAALIAVALVAALSLTVYAHAERHGSRRAPAWGISAFLSVGIVVPLYFMHYWLRRGSSR